MNKTFKWAKVMLIGAVLVGISIHPAAAASKKSASYSRGFNWVIETSYETLSSLDIRHVFGANGQPVVRKAKFWCKQMHSRVSPTSSYSEWVKGCSAAVMTIGRR